LSRKKPDQEKIRFSVLMSKNCGAGKFSKRRNEDFPDRLYVNGLTASFIAASLRVDAPYAVLATPEGDMAIDDSGTVLTTYPPHSQRCTCHP
jgi:hypothetical protein